MQKNDPKEIDAVEFIWHLFIMFVFVFVFIMAPLMKDLKHMHNIPIIAYAPATGVHSHAGMMA